ncbi:MAG: 3-deoxy-manno-octulosonate cytidylyltransferase [Gemmatimonadota bacterium]|nr:3-deoxy-manno-octulosonate cytidylyltransferase [Gemmatimonadota bacterium]
MDVICVLPARLSSTRIPKKLLSELAGRSLLEWAWRAANRVSAFDRIVIATDAEELEREARAIGADVVATRPDHPSGTDRVEEAAGLLGVREDDVIVNFQADEPFVDPDTVTRAVRAVAADPSIDIATVAGPVSNREEWQSPGVVKIARAADGRALYFSRSPIPFVRDGEPDFGGHGSETDGSPRAPLRHVGLYVCRRPALRRWAGAPETALERLERLEQLRALELGMWIHVEVGPATEPGVDLPADLGRAERVLTDASW